jgi:hypothetical protein
VINLGHDKAKASDYTIRVDGNNQSPDTFQVSEEGAGVTLGFDSYLVSETSPPVFVKCIWFILNLVRIIKALFI